MSGDGGRHLDVGDLDAGDQNDGGHDGGGRPMLRTGVTVDPPLNPGDPWIISLDGVPRARVGAEIAARVSRLPTQPHRSSVPAAPPLAATTSANAGAGAGADASGAGTGASGAGASALPLDDDLMSALRNAGLLASDRPTDARPARPRWSLLSGLTGRGRGVGERRTTSGSRLGTSLGSRDGVPGRLAIRPPMSLQLTLVDPSRTAALIARTIGSAARLRLVVIIALLIVLGGAVAAAVVSADLLAVVDSPLPVAAVPVVLVGALAASFVHEWSHAIALSAAGGRPTRLGVMLFYLTPAFFCDVTDGWRLGDRGRRAGVALAGPALHLLLAACCAILLLVLRSIGSSGSSIGVALALCCVAFAATVVANLLPFVALDGYLALVALVDEPHLRAHTMAESTQAFVRLLGGDVASARATTRRRILFGLCCTLFPFALVGSTLGRLAPALVASGPIGAVLLLLLDLIVLAMIVRRLTSLVRALRVGRARPRRALVALAGLVAILACVASVPVPRTVVAGFVRSDVGVDLVSARSDDLAAAAAGDAVTLQQNGVVLHPVVGHARIVDATARTATTAPTEAFLPVHIEGATVDATSIALHETGGADAHDRGVLAGRAVVDLGGSTPLGMSVVERLIAAPITSIRSLLTTESSTS